ncbi:uncharacterized protein EI90DRAFT_3069584 [Cantharellus anzutake]|uniref:uncharacterized protein n=1 Tax=Cantharellus anzutake TaxID=1750568 RepID=UPI001907C486|nr:uncharacterized protein EI90DRAFT_3069584 [Cantharellus anzutake]KAF8326542.1 hypothetical protein EI90DRAFT_3069584 [Cantharellus anzutake]
MAHASSDRPGSSLSDYDDYASSVASSASTHSFNDGGPRSNFGGFSFIFKHDSKHHPYNVTDAPYPLCYDRFILDCDVFNVIQQHWATGRLGYGDRPGSNPVRLLDIGCVWIIEAAKRWPETSFPDVELLDDPIGSRISWVLGNFLKTPWPFENGEFDHIVIRFIAKGVPELSWDAFFQEVSRVLAPSGIVEYVEEDVIFPRIPSLEPLTSDSSSDRSSRSDVKDTEYDEDNLESLFKEVYLERNISLIPTRIIPYYLNIYFQYTTIPARIYVPFPDIYSSLPAPNLSQSSKQTCDPVHRIPEGEYSSDLRAYPVTSSQLSPPTDQSAVPLFDATPGYPSKSESQPQSRKLGPLRNREAGDEAVNHTERKSLDPVTDMPNNLQNTPPLFMDYGELAFNLFTSAMGVLAVREAMLSSLGSKSRDVQEAREAFEGSLDIFVARLSKSLAHSLEYPFLDGALRSVLGDGKQVSERVGPTPESRDPPRSDSFDKELLSQISSTVLSAILQQEASPLADIHAPAPTSSASEKERERAHSSQPTSPSISPDYLPGQRNHSSNDTVPPPSLAASMPGPWSRVIAVSPLPTDKASRVIRFFFAEKAATPDAQPVPGRYQTSSSSQPPES